MNVSTENSVLIMVAGVALVLMFSSFSNISSQEFTGNVANEPAEDSLAENAVCQRDSQCQGVLVCRKLVSRQTNQFYGDKKCKPARNNGETCEENNYCRSRQCGADKICKARSNLGANEFCDTNNECRSGYCDTTRAGRCGTPPGRNMRGSGSFCTADNDCAQPYVCRPGQAARDMCRNKGLVPSDACRDNNDCESSQCMNKNNQGIGTCASVSRSEGQECITQTNAECNTGLVCRKLFVRGDQTKWSGTKFFCKQPISNGSICARDDQCVQGGVCTNHLCVVPQQMQQQPRQEPQVAEQAVQREAGACQGYGLEQRPDAARYPKGIVCGPSRDVPRFERTVLFTTQDGVSEHPPDGLRANAYVYTSSSCTPRYSFTQLVYNTRIDPAPQGHHAAPFGWVTSRVDPTCSIAQQRSVGPRFQSSEIGFSFVPGTGGGCFVYEPDRARLSADFGGRQGSICMICDNNPESQQDCFRLANNARQAGLI